MSATVRIPIIRLYDNLIVSIQFALSDRVVSELKQDVTREIELKGANGLVLDVSGVDLMDSYLTRAVHDLAVIGRWMGVKTVVCGLQPSVAVTLVDMGMDLRGVSTVLNLEKAIAVLRTEHEGQALARSGAGG